MWLLVKLTLVVLRFWDHEVFRETEVVLQRIADLLAARGTE
jgi:very-short-patch-repair endonuclease